MQRFLASQGCFLQPEEFHVITASNRNRVSNANGVDPLKLYRVAPTIRGVAALRGVRSSCIWLGIVEAKDPSPLLDRLVVVGWVQSSVSTAMIDLHLWIAAGIARIHVFNHLPGVSDRDSKESSSVSNAILTPAQTCGVLWI